MKFQSTLLAVAVASTVFLVSCDKVATDKSAPADNANTKPAGAEASAKALTFDDDNFATETATGVVLVDFWATWCPPCRAQGPIVDKVAKKVHGVAKVGKLDVDQAKKIAKQYGISSIPTLIILKDGKKIKQFVGLTEEAELVSALKAAAGK